MSPWMECMVNSPTKRLRTSLDSRLSLSRFNFLFNNEILSDINFIVGKNKQFRIPAHKLILAAASDVFETLFFGSLATKSDQIKLPDIEPTIFLAFLKFIYTDEMKIDHETVMSTLYVAKKYNVTALEDYCVDYLETNLDCDHAVLLLRQAKFFNEPELADKCLNIIDQNTIEVLAVDDFNDIDLETLIELLKRDTLQIKESKLYEAVLRWTEVECARRKLTLTSEKQRLVLGPAIKLIRFPLMTIEEFNNGPVQSGLLTDREIQELMLNITVNSKPAVEFSDVPRHCEKLIRNEQVVNRFKSIRNKFLIRRCINDGINLMVDRPIFLVGFGLYGSKQAHVLLDVDLELIHKDTNIVCASNKASIQTSDGSNQTYKVKFKEPIKITPNTNYTASVTITTKPVGCWYYGTEGQSQVIINDLNGKPITFQFASIGRGFTDVIKGQIPEIIFTYL
ncbi:BTB/POZ domain-containing protein 2-like [Chrysoperla carnea]|uniref:BTB/POZ domain-containing protein 2-like n=1 Tax=Chrysoperla carnea TaxID=189513 RepID=UPI001D092DB1|nr:BTB/POZ domain-containing protein 2-like [Chrysoperla carnea]